MTPVLTIGAAQARARRTLEEISETFTLDAQVLLADLLGRPRSWILAHPEFCLGRPEEESFGHALARLAGGEPLAYVLGWWEFYGRRFHVTPAVLIPRPETELLVETALEIVRSDGRLRRAVDVGTGSGCIAVTLAAEIPGLKLIASDISAKALEVCRDNVYRHRVGNQVDLVQADLVGPLAGPIDLVLSNLPYIPSATLVELAVARREPAIALDGGPDGLGPLRRLLEQLRRTSRSRTVVVLEIGADQGALAMAEARAAFPSASVRVVQDLAGRDRIMVIRLDRVD